MAHDPGSLGGLPGIPGFEFLPWVVIPVMTVAGAAPWVFSHFREKRRERRRLEWEATLVDVKLPEGAGREPGPLHSALSARSAATAGQTKDSTSANAATPDES
jgi:hypothetical protein